MPFKSKCAYDGCAVDVSHRGNFCGAHSAMGEALISASYKEKVVVNVGRPSESDFNGHIQKMVEPTASMIGHLFRPYRKSNNQLTNPYPFMLSLVDYKLMLVNIVTGIALDGKCIVPEGIYVIHVAKSAKEYYCGKNDQD